MIFHCKFEVAEFDSSRITQAKEEQKFLNSRELPRLFIVLVSGLVGGFVFLFVCLRGTVSG